MKRFKFTLTSITSDESMPDVADFAVDMQKLSKLLHRHQDGVILSDEELFSISKYLLLLLDAIAEENNKNITVVVEEVIG